MKRKIITLATAGILSFGVVGPAFAVTVEDPTPIGAFSDGSGNKGYVQADEAGALRACNENDETPAGDQATGYIWVNPAGEPTTPTYGTAQVGAGDADGEGAAKGNDCP